MKIELDEIHDYFTGKSFDTFITKDKLLIIMHPIEIKKHHLWIMHPNTNIGNDLNYFYSVFPSGDPEGDWEYIQQSLIKYYEKYIL